MSNDEFVCVYVCVCVCGPCMRRACFGHQIPFPHQSFVSLNVIVFPKTATLCLGWNPLFKANLAEDTPSEFVFLVDRGKALQGRKMARVKSALYLWLHSLPSGCTFNLIGFGEAVVKLYQTRCDVVFSTVFWSQSIN